MKRLNQLAGIHKNESKMQYARAVMKKDNDDEEKHYHPRHPVRRVCRM